MYNRFVGTVFFAAVLLARQGYSQCFNNTDCSGTEVTANDERGCCVGTDDGRSYRLGTSCRPCIVHGFERTAYCVIERGRSGSAGAEGKLDIIFRPNVKGMQQGIVRLPGEISVDDRSTAKGGTDYDTILPTTVPTNSTTISLITRNDDVTLENDDNVILVFNPSFQGLITPGVFIRNTTTVTIEDNDLLKINFDLREYGFTEGTNIHPLIRLQFTEIQNPFDITVTPVEISSIEGVGNFSSFITFDDIATQGARATAGDDFDNTPVTFRVYPDDPVPYVFTEFINVKNEEIVEVDQFFALVAVIGQNVPEGTSCFQNKVSGLSECFGRVGATRIKIFNDDTMVVGFAERYQTFNESRTPGQDEERFPITIIISSKRVSEQGYRMQFSVQSSLTTATVVPQTAITADADVVFDEQIQDLHPGSKGVNITATGMDDLRPEGDECFTILIEPIDTALRATFSCISDSDITSTENSYFCLHTVCIVDDDDPFVVEFVETTYTVDESVGSVNVCVNLTQPEVDILDETVNVLVIDNSSSVYIPDGAPLATHDVPDSSDMYPMREGTDFQQRTSSFDFFNPLTTITATVRVVCYNQIIYDDQCLEPDEYLGLTLGIREASVNTLVEPMYGQASILIRDNDVAVVGLEETFYVVPEGDMVAVCCIVYSPSVSCPIKFPFNVSLSTVDQSAVSPMDYGALSTNLTFDTCETRVCAMISIMNDAIPEGTESFNVTLEGTPGLDDRIKLDPVDGEIQIIDSDVAVVGLERTLYQVSEGVGYVLVCAVVFRPDENTDCPIGFAFNVEISTTDGTAVQIMDYDSLNMTLQFAECERMSCVNITINEDETLENIESFNVTLEGTSGLDDRITLDPVDGEIQIIDIDVAVVGLERTLYQVSEGVGYVLVCAVVISPDEKTDCPIAFAFDVELCTTDGTAVQIMDYVSLDTTLQFAECDRMSCVNITINEDETLENIESFNVTLERNGLDSNITLNPTRAEIEIRDDGDAVIGLERTLYSIREGSAPTVEVCIVVYEPTGDCPIAFPFSVMFSTSDLTAVVDNDYLDADTTQIFGACATRRCISVPIVDDSIGEPDEQVSISLGDPSDSRIIASPKEGLINIIDSIQVVYVNDTVTGDPLMTVPVATLPDTSTLCYEVHGEADKFFNLISDNCVSVNAHYAKVGINNPNITLNIIDAVGIRAVSNIDSCVNIRVGLEGCTASIDSVDLSGMYRGNGIMVRKYSSRVRITVPNCEDTDLVMWVFCTRGGTEDPYTWEYFSFNFLRFVVMRGLNLREESHGLLGQFWNIEIKVEEHADLFNGASRSDDYTVTVHPNDPNDPNDPNRERSFVALESSVTWEFEKKPCLYVGNSQAGPLGEDVAPNESVIEGSYKDYMVDSMFSPNFIFAHFDQDNCMAK